MNQQRQENPMDAGTVIAAALVAAAIGALFYNVLPLYVGAAQDFRSLDNRQVGFLSSAFFLGYNVVTISAFFWIRRVRWSLIVATATPIAAISLYCGTLTSNYFLLVSTVIIAGGAFAVLYGVGTTILGDTSNPARWYGVKIAAEAVPGVVLLLLLPSTAIARWGFDGAVIGLIIALIFLSPVLFWIPARGTKGQNSAIAGVNTSNIALPQSVHIWGTLLATLTFFTGASATWAFIERIGAHGGFASASVGLLLSVTLVFAVLGSLMAAVLDGRYGNLKPFAGGAFAFLIALYLLSLAGEFALYAVGACLMTGAFGFILPFAITEVAELDQDGRYVILSVPAIGIGAMIGPGIGGVLSPVGSFAPLLLFGAATMIVSTMLIVISGVSSRKYASALLTSGNGNGR
jgi:predicted MFS family arabinose efflux permease